MSKAQVLKELYSTYENYLAKKSLPKGSLSFEEVLASIFCPGETFYYVLDSPTLTFENVSQEAHRLLGLELEGQPLGILIDRVHPDDVDFMFACEDYVANFLRNLESPEKVLRYKISYCLREIVVDGSYRLFLIQNTTIAITPEGALLKVLGVHSDISTIVEKNNYLLSLTGLNGEPSFTGIDVMNTRQAIPIQPSRPLFTRRELEVIGYLAMGHTSKEIAQLLHVSTETINTHKKNALVKANCRNTAQLISFSIRSGLV